MLKYDLDFIITRLKWQKDKYHNWEWKTYLGSDEVALLENAATSLRDKILVKVLFHLGCRISEALAIAVEDVDFTQSNVTIQHLKTRLQESHLLSWVWGKSRKGSYRCERTPPATSAST